MNSKKVINIREGNDRKTINSSTVFWHLHSICAILVLLALGACGGGSVVPPPVTAIIGPSGGTVTGPGGAQVVIPEGALSQDIEIGIAQTSDGAPALPAGTTSLGAMFAFTPHGTTFNVPVTMTVPFDTGAVPAVSTPELFKTNAARSAFEPVAGATVSGGTMTGQVMGFSDAVVVVPSLQRNDPERDWKFKVYLGNGQGPDILPGLAGSGKQVGGLLEKTVPFGFGPGLFDHAFVQTNGVTHEPDFRADGFIFSSADGGTYGVFTEAPLAQKGGPEPIGSIAELTQTQSFKKLTDNASLTFTLTNVFIDTTDFHADFPQNDAAREALLILGEVFLSVSAHKTENDPAFFYTAGRASVQGNGSIWVPQANDDSTSRSHLWSMGDFDFSTTPIFDSVGGGVSGCAGTGVVLKLKKPLTYTIDISSVGIEEEFTLEVNTFAEALNRRGGGNDGESCGASSASAFLRDPLEIGGTTLITEGLEPTNNPLPAPPVQVLVPPASCEPGPGPNAAAGVLQFDAAAYTIGEFAGALPTITVTRTGGSVGAVTATFTSSDGTALSGTDYTPLNATVFFADGDTGQRVVEIPILQDLSGEPNETINLTLSEPGGCAALGTQTTATLTILDEAPPFTIGGTVTGLEGSGLVLKNLGQDLPIAGNGAFTFDQAQSISYNVTVATHPTNPAQLCTVSNGSGPAPTANITNVAVNCVTEVPNPALDSSFGSAGKVTTDFGANDALALQQDGKIVMVGADFELARYNSDGSLDGSFGTGGLASTESGGVLEQANAVAIQADGKIIVVGAGFSSDFSRSFALARYNTDGSLDTSFGEDSSGIIRTEFEFDCFTDLANDVAIQSDGKIVVVGEATLCPLTGGTNTDFAIARYNTDGSLDESFDTDGKVTTDFDSKVESAISIALQPDGKIVVAGRKNILDDTILARYNDDGSLDGSFGTDGKVTLVDEKVSGAMVLQSDGKIVLTGGSTSEPNGFLVTRLTTSGDPDLGFGSGGRATFNFGGEFNEATALALQTDNKIVVAGEGIASNGFGDFMLVRYNLDGTPDTSFGSDGKLTIDILGGNDLATCMAVQPDGKIVVGGSRGGGIRLARVNP